MINNAGWKPCAPAKICHEDGLDTAKMLVFSVFWQRKNSKSFLIYCFRVSLFLNFNYLFHLQLYDFIDYVFYKPLIVFHKYKCRLCFSYDFLNLYS